MTHFRRCLADQARGNGYRVVDTTDRQVGVDKPRTLAGRDRAAGEPHPGDFDWLPAGAVAYQIDKGRS